MKAVIVKDIKEATKIKDLVDAFLLPIKDFSINYYNTFTLEEVKAVQQLDREDFVIVNKNIFNNELPLLEELLLEIEKLNVKGIFFYDIAVLTLKNKHNLKTDLVWSQEHLTTNFETINYWYAKGVKYAYISSELTKEEINNISKHTKATLFVNVFGYQPMFTSRRNLVNNYLKYFNLKDKSHLKHISKEGKSYPILDTKEGTTVYSNYVLNVAYEDIKAKYLVYNTYLIDDIEKVLKDNNYPKETGFLYQETIYRVKKK